MTSRAWQIDRHIFDFKTQKISFFSGTATFQLQTRNKKWLYLEKGTLTTPSGVYHSNRSLIYCLDLDRLGVYFANGDFFHSIELKKSPLIYYTHQCGSDTYFGQMVIFRDSWSTHWDIVGFNKKMTIHSRFHPQEGPKLVDPL